MTRSVEDVENCCRWPYFYRCRNEWHNCTFTQYMHIEQSIDQAFTLKLQLHFTEAKTDCCLHAEMKMIILQIGIFAAMALGEHMYPIVIKPRYTIHLYPGLKSVHTCKLCHSSSVTKLIVVCSWWRPSWSKGSTINLATRSAQIPQEKIFCSVTKCLSYDTPFKLHGQNHSISCHRKNNCNVLLFDANISYRPEANKRYTIDTGSLCCAMSRCFHLRNCL